MKTMKELKKLWEQLGDIPVDEDNYIEKAFLHFPIGTDIYDIWHWFEEQNNHFVCGDVMRLGNSYKYFHDVHVREIGEFTEEMTKEERDSFKFPNGWLIHYADCEYVEFPTEDEACVAQRKHRKILGCDPYTGE